MVSGAEEDGSCGKSLHSDATKASRPFQGFGGVGPGVRDKDPRGARKPGPYAGTVGSRIKEKATLLKKIEREEISPEDDIRKKLERELKIKLTDQVNEAKQRSGSGNRGLTLGDIASIKRK